MLAGPPVQEVRDVPGQAGVGWAAELAAGVLSPEAADVPGRWLTRRDVTVGAEK